MFVAFLEFMVFFELELELFDFVANIDGRFGCFASVLPRSFSLAEFI